MKGLPNTYAYTKALTEDLVNSYSGKIPIVITRPSIGIPICLYHLKFAFENEFFDKNYSLKWKVTAAWKEPYPGWVEGMNGPTGLMVGAARGKTILIIPFQTIKSNRIEKL